MENAAKSTGNNFCCSSTARGSSAGVRETSLIATSYWKYSYLTTKLIYQLIIDHEAAHM